jgi:hypothetical protein
METAMQADRDVHRRTLPPDYCTHLLKQISASNHFRMYLRCAIAQFAASRCGVMIVERQKGWPR